MPNWKCAGAKFGAKLIAARNCEMAPSTSPAWSSRRPEFVEEVVEQAIQLKVPAVWMQEEVIHEKAAQKARAAGIFVVMDRCILLEHRARFR